MYNHELFLSILFIFACFGIFCSIIFLLLLYFTKRKKEVEGYGMAVAQNCIIDLIFVSICAVARFDNTSTKGYFIYMVTVFDYEISEIWIKVFVISMIFFCALGMCCIGKDLRSNYFTTIIT